MKRDNYRTRIAELEQFKANATAVLVECWSRAARIRATHDHRPVTDCLVDALAQSAMLRDFIVDQLRELGLEVHMMAGDQAGSDHAGGEG